MTVAGKEKGGRMRRSNSPLDAYLCPLRRFAANLLSSSDWFPPYPSRKNRAASSGGTGLI